jgi:NADPH:quinone reductase-like Zn-dependent oxidoreductase
LREGSCVRAGRIDRFGTLEVLDVVDAPEPRPGPEEVLVKAVATSRNPVDDKTREGGAIREGTPPLPMTLGWDLAGIVVDGGGTGPRAGERVIAMSHQLARPPSRPVRRSAQAGSCA